MQAPQNQTTPTTKIVDNITCAQQYIPKLIALLEASGQNESVLYLQRLQELIQLSPQDLIISSTEYNYDGIEVHIHDVKCSGPRIGEDTIVQKLLDKWEQHHGAHQRDGGSVNVRSPFRRGLCFGTIRNIPFLAVGLPKAFPVTIDEAVNMVCDLEFPRRLILSRKLNGEFSLCYLLRVCDQVWIVAGSKNVRLAVPLSIQDGKAELSHDCQLFLQQCTNIKRFRFVHEMIRAWCQQLHSKATIEILTSKHLTLLGEHTGGSLAHLTDTSKHEPNEKHNVPSTITSFGLVTPSASMFATVGNSPVVHIHQDQQLALQGIACVEGSKVIVPASSEIDKHYETTLSLRETLKRVASGSMDEYGEGLVLYVVNQCSDRVYQIAKFKNQEYGLARYVRTLVEQRVSKSCPGSNSDGQLDNNENCHDITKAIATTGLQRYPLIPKSVHVHWQHLVPFLLEFYRKHPGKCIQPVAHFKEAIVHAELEFKTCAQPLGQHSTPVNISGTVLRIAAVVEAYKSRLTLKRDLSDEYPRIAKLVAAKMVEGNYKGVCVALPIQNQRLKLFQCILEELKLRKPKQPVHASIMENLTLPLSSDVKDVIQHAQYVLLDTSCDGGSFLTTSTTVAPLLQSRVLLVLPDETSIVLEEERRRKRKSTPRSFSGLTQSQAAMLMIDLRTILETQTNENNLRDVLEARLKHGVLHHIVQRCLRKDHNLLQITLMPTQQREDQVYQHVAKDLDQLRSSFGSIENRRDTGTNESAVPKSAENSKKRKRTKNLNSLDFDTISQALEFIQKKNLLQVHCVSAVLHTDQVRERLVPLCCPEFKTPKQGQQWHVTLCFAPNMSNIQDLQFIANSFTFKTTLVLKGEHGSVLQCFVVDQTPKFVTDITPNQHLHVTMGTTSRKHLPPRASNIALSFINRDKCTNESSSNPDDATCDNVSLLPELDTKVKIQNLEIEPITVQVKYFKVQWFSEPL